MSSEVVSTKLEIPKGVMLNAYPDSVGGKLADIVAVLKKPELRDVFSLFYILPTFFNSDLDRGFSIIDYELNDELVSRDDLAELDDLNIKLKFDLVLNHLSVGSPQFQDMLKFGDKSQYRHFFIGISLSIGMSFGVCTERLALMAMWCRKTSFCKSFS